MSEISHCGIFRARQFVVMIKTLVFSFLFCAFAVCGARAQMAGDKMPKFDGETVLELRTYHAAPGKLDALLTRFRDHTCGLFTKHGMASVCYWVPAENPDNLLVYLLAFPDMDSRNKSWKEFSKDPDWKKAAAESQRDGKLVEKVDQLFLIPTDFAEGFGVPFAGDAERLFEMRTYTATEGELASLDSRFRDHTLTLFKRHGITNLGYFHLSPDQPGAENTLLYFIAHKDAEAAKKSWEDFRNDRDWVAVKKASEEKAGGSLTVEGGVKSLYLKPTDFSPVR